MQSDPRAPLDAPLAEGTGRAPRVLVVDDEPAVLGVLRASLRALGYDVETGASGAEALRVARTSSVDVVVLDYFMEPMDGAAVLAALRADGRTMPVVILTGNPEEACLGLSHRRDITAILGKADGARALDVVLRGALPARSGGRRAAPPRAAER